MSLERMGGDAAQGGHAQWEQQDSGQSRCGGGGAQRGPHGVRVWAWHRIEVGKAVGEAVAGVFRVMSLRSERLLDLQ